MASDPRVDVLRYPDSVAEPRVRAVRAGEGETVVREATREHRRQRRKDRFPLWISVPLITGAMSIGPTDQFGLPVWTPAAVAAASLSLLWWLFTAVDARRTEPVPELVATDCPVAVARERFGATVVGETGPPTAGETTATTWTGESTPDGSAASEPEDVGPESDEPAPGGSTAGGSTPVETRNREEGTER